MAKVDVMSAFFLFLIREISQIKAPSGYMREADL
jgi:hypothetical protein